MPVAVVDVGSNTVRLLVSSDGRTDFTIREPVELGAAVEQFGLIPAAKLDETGAVISAFAAAARKAGAEHLEVLITSPGRQAANGSELLETASLAAKAPARILTAEEEGRLAFVGALAGASGLARRHVAVVDVGGGSAQVAIGTRATGPVWVRSLDIGSLRLSNRLLPGDPPGDEAIAIARQEVEAMLEGFDPPPAQAGMAVGGTARTLRRIIGPRLDTENLTFAIKVLARATQHELIDRFDLPPHRAHTLAAGAVIIEAIQERLAVPLKVSRTGLREGALTELAARRVAA